MARRACALKIRTDGRKEHITIAFSLKWDDPAGAEKVLKRFVGKAITIQGAHRRKPSDRSLYFRSEVLSAFREELSKCCDIDLQHDFGDPDSFHMETTRDAGAIEGKEVVIKV